MKPLKSVEDSGDIIADLYKKIIEEIQDYAIIVLNKQGIITHWNTGAEKIKQYTEQEIKGKHFSIFYQPEDIERKLPETLLTEAEATGRTNSEGWRIRKDGTAFWANVTITAIHDNAGNTIGFSKVTRDLTEKKLGEDKLRMSEERYHKMIAEVQDYAIILLDNNGIILNWNAGAEKIKGYLAGEIIGSRFDIFYTTEDRKAGLADKLLRIARETGRASHEGWRVRKDGSRFWGSITITTLHNNDGGIMGFTKVTRDLTQKKLAEDKLAAYNAELQRQNTDLEQFAYVASHDLQEPLRKIQTFAEIIKEHFDDRGMTERYLDKLMVSARRMTDLIKSLLNYSRLSREQQTTEQVDLNKVLADVQMDLELLIEEKGAQVIAQSLPTVKGSYSQLTQVFANLIANSLKFSEETPVIRINCITLTGDEIPDKPEYIANKTFYVLSFEDNGIGFDEEYKSMIFSLFQRLHGRHEYPGTGIGLALCKRIAENHGGFITASSQPGKGATFRVCLPVE